MYLILRVLKEPVLPGWMSAELTNVRELAEGRARPITNPVARSDLVHVAGLANCRNLEHLRAPSPAHFELAEVPPAVHPRLPKLFDRGLSQPGA